MGRQAVEDRPGCLSCTFPALQFLMNFSLFTDVLHTGNFGPQAAG